MKDAGLLFVIEAPKNFSFSYLVKHPNASVAVVCGGDQAVEGWYDWHFSINPKNGSLERLAPAY